MRASTNDQSGFSLIEVLIAISVLTVGAIGMAAVFAQGLQHTISSPNELAATQKAAEAIESVFAARDSRTVAWAQLANKADGGVFLDGATPVNLAGNDAILNTGDSGETLEAPEFARFTRRIQISALSSDLRSITVTITYPAGPVFRSYVLTTYISAYA